MSADIFMGMLNGILVFSAIIAKILTSNLILRQKKQVAELTAAKQGKIQRMQAVHKRLASLQNTHDMTARKRNNLQDDIDSLKSELSELERQGQGASSIPEETDQDQESDGEETDQDQESDETETREIRSCVGRGSSLYEDEAADSKKPRKIRTYIDKIKSGRGKSQDSTNSDN